jgi:hypothetical protein
MPTKTADLCDEHAARCAPWAGVVVLPEGMTDSK